MFSNPRKDMEDAFFQIKLTSKQMIRMAKKSEAEIKKNEDLVKKSIEKGNNAGARIYAENAIRKKQEAINYLQMASRLDAAAGRLETALAMNTISKSMAKGVRGMNKALNGMNLEKLTAVMDGFERNFENLDVQTSVMESSIGTSVVSSIPEDQVDQLIQKVADDHGIEVQQKMGIFDTCNLADPVKTEIDIDDRLRALRENDDDE